MESVLSPSLLQFHRPPSRRRANKTTLFEIHWKRVILDEAHVIRNPKTALSIGACQLKCGMFMLLPSPSSMLNSRLASSVSLGALHVASCNVKGAAFVNVKLFTVHL